MSDFREKYRMDNELLKAPDSLPEGVINMTESKESKSRKPVITIVSVAAAACVLLAVLICLPIISNHGRGIDLPLTEVVSVGDLHSAADYDEIYDAVRGLREENGSDYYAGFGVLTDGAVMEDAVVEEAEPEMAPEMPETGATTAAPQAVEPEVYNGTADDAGKDYSATNTQKENVDEADIIKTDGDYIYRLSCGTVYIIDPVNMTTVTSIDAVKDNTPENGWFGVSNIYVSGDRLAILYNKEIRSDGSDWRYDSFSGVLVYDITDRAAPALIGDCSQSGYLNDSRLIGDYIYLVTSYGVYGDIDENDPETYVPLLCVDGQSAPMAAADVCVLPEPNASTYAVISSVNIRTGNEFAATEATFGCGSTVYADTERIILACSNGGTEEEETTENGENVTIRTYSDSTKLISYTISEGAVNLTATGTVPGSLLNQFSIDRHKGVLRVVTTGYTSVEKIYTDGIDRYDWSSTSSNGLYTLDDGMNIIGSLDGLAQDERVYSVRFSGDMGYFVTFRQVDPLFAVDLSDPTNPTLLSALKIPGFSQYMHPFADGLMLGLGMDADEETGATNCMKLSMFDISNPADVTEKHKLLLEDISYSEALYNHKAALVSADRDVIAFPTWNGYLVYGYSADSGFYERYVLELDHDKLNGTLRSLYIGDSFYICSDYTLFRFDIDDFEATGELTFADPEQYTTWVEEVYAEEDILFATTEVDIAD